MPIRFISPEIDPYIGAVIVIAIFGFLVYLISRIKMKKTEGGGVSNPERRSSKSRLPAETQSEAATARRDVAPEGTKKEVVEAEKTVRDEKISEGETLNIVRCIKNMNNAIQQFIETEMKIENFMIPQSDKINEQNILYLIEDEKKFFEKEEGEITKEKSLLYYYAQTFEALKKHFKTEINIERILLNETDNLRRIIGTELYQINRNIAIINARIGEIEEKEIKTEYAKLQKLRKEYQILGILYRLTQKREKLILRIIEKFTHLSNEVGEITTVDYYATVDSYQYGILEILEELENYKKQAESGVINVSEAVKYIQKEKAGWINLKKREINRTAEHFKNFYPILKQIEDAIEDMTKEIKDSRLYFRAEKYILNLEHQSDLKGFNNRLRRADNTIKRNLSGYLRSIRETKKIYKKQDKQMGEFVEKLDFKYKELQAHSASSIAVKKAYDLYMGELKKYGRDKNLMYKIIGSLKNIDKNRKSYNIVLVNIYTNFLHMHDYFKYIENGFKLMRLQDLSTKNMMVNFMIILKEDIQNFDGLNKELAYILNVNNRLEGMIDETNNSVTGKFNNKISKLTELHNEIKSKTITNEKNEKIKTKLTEMDKELFEKLLKDLSRIEMMIIHINKKYRGDLNQMFNNLQSNLMRFNQFLSENPGLFNQTKPDVKMSSMLYWLYDLTIDRDDIKKSIRYSGKGRDAIPTEGKPLIPELREYRNQIEYYLNIYVQQMNEIIKISKIL